MVQSKAFSIITIKINKILFQYTNNLQDNLQHNVDQFKFTLFYEMDAEECFETREEFALRITS